MGRARRGRPHQAATGERVDVSDEQTAQELAQLDADVLAVLAAIGGNEPMDPRLPSPDLRVVGHEKAPHLS
ncbi:hypothetical protein [Nocardia salmonicida]